MSIFSVPDYAISILEFIPVDPDFFMMGWINKLFREIVGNTLRQNHGTDRSELRIRLTHFDMTIHNCPLYPISIARSEWRKLLKQNSMIHIPGVSYPVFAIDLLIDNRDSLTSVVCDDTEVDRVVANCTNLKQIIILGGWRDSSYYENKNEDVVYHCVKHNTNKRHKWVESSKNRFDINMNFESIVQGFDSDTFYKYEKLLKLDPVVNARLMVKSIVDTKIYRSMNSVEVEPHLSTEQWKRLLSTLSLSMSVICSSIGMYNHCTELYLELLKHTHRNENGIELFKALCALGVRNSDMDTLCNELKKNYISYREAIQSMELMVNHLVNDCSIDPRQLSHFHLMDGIDCSSLKNLLSVPTPCPEEIIKNSSFNTKLIMTHLTENQKLVPDKTIEFFHWLNVVEMEEARKMEQRFIYSYYRDCLAPPKRNTLMGVCRKEFEQFSLDHPAAWRTVIGLVAISKNMTSSIFLGELLEPTELMYFVNFLVIEVIKIILKPTHQQIVGVVGHYGKELMSHYTRRITYPHTHVEQDSIAVILDHLWRRLEIQMARMKVVQIGSTDNHINIGGGSKKNKWANPFDVKQDKGTAKALELYRRYLKTRPQLVNDLYELDGRVLLCACNKKHSNNCHGNLLIEMRKKQIKQEFEKQKIRILQQ
jgi:hypothetical protein